MKKLSKIIKSGALNENPVFISMLDKYESRKAAFKTAKKELKKWLAENGAPKKVKKAAKNKAEKAPKSDKAAVQPAKTKAKAAAGQKNPSKPAKQATTKSEAKPVAKTTTTRRRVSPKTEAK